MRIYVADTGVSLLLDYYVKSKWYFMMSTGRLHNFKQEAENKVEL